MYIYVCVCVCVCVWLFQIVETKQRHISTPCLFCYFFLFSDFCGKINNILIYFLNSGEIVL